MIDYVKVLRRVLLLKGVGSRDSVAPRVCVDSGRLASRGRRKRRRGVKGRGREVKR